MSINAPGSLLAEQFDLLTKLTTSLNREQLTWVSGYLAGFSAQNQEHAARMPEITPNPVQDALTILFGSRTGNGEGLAKKAQALAEKIGIRSVLKNMADYRPRDLQAEKNILVIVSTHGEGVPPFSAAELHQYIYGKRAPKLESVKYAVLALGDSSYFQFCKTGRDFDEQLEKLGAVRVVPLLTCDVDFDQPAEEWLKKTLENFAGETSNQKATAATDQLPAAAVASDITVKFSKKNPFKAPVFEKIPLHGKGSERQTFHIELAADVKGLEYEPGDSAAVIPVNPDHLIEEVIKEVNLNGNEEVEINGVKMKLRDALQHKLELSKITADVVKRYLTFAPDSRLQQLTEKPEEFRDYLYGRDIVDLLREFPAKISAEDLTRLLRPLQPRSYSISSSPKAFPGELHLTVGEVEYENRGRRKRGACSGFLAKVDIEKEQVPIYIESNPNFRLPKDASTPIVMIGAGTGIAPYRAFVQHRELSENRGKSWLFFGNRNFETEFLYQTEWQNFLKTGALTRMDVAFSRDGSEKRYVQHQLIENSAELYKWLKEGAHFYICGDMSKMAGDVQAALLKIVEKEGAMNTEGAREYVDNLQKERRLQLDVY